MTRVLIVDDKEENLYYLQALLAGHECTVDSAHNGAEALEKARQAAPDVVISDLLMPVMDGFTLLSHWKADLQLKHIPFIVYTATYTDPEDERLALSLGADAFILKPAEPEDFLFRLREVQATAAVTCSARPKKLSGEEKILLKVYNETLIRKLEEKTLQLEEANRALKLDVTARAQADLLLKKSEERLALATQSAQIGIWDWDVALNEMIWDRQMYALYGIHAQDFSGAYDAWQNGLHPEDRVRAEAEIEAALKGHEDFHTEFRVRWPGGEVRHIEAHGVVQRVADGSAQRMIGVNWDITPRKTAETRLLQSAEEFRVLAEAMPQIVWITRADGFNIYFNQQWVDYTGLTLNESCGHGWNKPFHPEDQQRASEAWELATATTGTYSLEARLRRSNGDYRWWLIRGVPLRNDRGGVLNWFGTCTDIDDLKVAELEISRINRALKMLSACNDTLIRADREQALLDDICRIAVEEGGYRMAWVGYAQEDEHLSILPTAHAGAEEGYLSEIKVTWNEHEPHGQGPAGRTIRTGQAVICEDLAAEPAFEYWLATAQQRGYRSLICLPLCNAEHTFGLLVLYSAEVNRISAEELKLLQEMANNVAFGVQSLQTRSERRRLHAAVAKMASGAGTAGTEFFEQLASNLAEALGAHGAFMAQLLPGEPLAARTVAAVVEGKAVNNFAYNINGTPCANLLSDDTCVISKGVAERFPGAPLLAALGAQSYVGRRLDDSLGQPLGHIYVIFQKPLKATEFVTSTLEIFAARAAAELERLQTDAQMREQAALLDIVHDAIMVRDLDHCIRYWNRGAEAVYGWTSTEAIGRNVAELLRADAEALEAAHRCMLETGEWRGELSQFRKDGKPVIVSSRWTLMRDDKGNPKSMLTINTDITEHKKLESQFLRAQRLEGIGTLASGVAHDLNNILAPILMSAPMLRDEMPQDLRDRIVSNIEMSAQRGANIVRQVLTFARGAEGERLLVQPTHLIKDMARIAEETFSKSIHIRANYPPGAWAIEADPTQMHQVLLNLCVNARDAMPDGGELVLSMKNLHIDEHFSAMMPGTKPGPHVVIEVSDTGTGIPPEIVDQIFDPFFTTKAVNKGTGLGLSTTIGIVKSHGGAISVTSEIGAGTTFTVYLPAVEVTEAGGAAREEKECELPAQGHGELLLIVDDEESIRDMAQVILQKHGYRALVASDGTEALAIFAQQMNEFKAVLTDVMMPYMDGVTLIRTLRKMKPEIIVIASTGRSDERRIKELGRLNVPYCLIKPYNQTMLLSTVRDALAGAAL